MNNLVKAHLALIAVNIIYGASHIIAKFGMGAIAPKGFVLLRVIGATLLFWIVKLSIREKIQDKKDWYRLAGCGVFGVAMNQLFFFSGLHLTSPIHSSIIMTLNPIIVALLSVFLLRQRLKWINWSGIVIGFIGASWLILNTKNGTLNPSSELGDLFILINASSYAMYLVLVKPLMVKYKPITVITWVFTFGLMYVIPFGIQELISTEWLEFSLEESLSIAFVVVFTTFLTYLLNIFALAHVTPTISSSYIYSQPFFTFFISLTAVMVSPIFNDYQTEITASILLSTLLIFVGVYFVNIKPKKIR